MNLTQCCEYKPHDGIERLKMQRMGMNIPCPKLSVRRVNQNHNHTKRRPFNLEYGKVIPGWGIILLMGFTITLSSNDKLYTKRKEEKIYTKKEDMTQPNPNHQNVELNCCYSFLYLLFHSPIIQTLLITFNDLSLDIHFQRLLFGLSSNHFRQICYLL